MKSRMINSPLKIFTWYTLVLVMTGISVISVNSCNTEEDCTIQCFFGTCVNNQCNCNAGYEGDSCTILTTQKYIGDWDAIDTCQSNTYSYTATVAASASVVNRLVITNFGRFGSSFTITADVTGNSFTIPTQNVQGISLSGSGTINVIDTTLSYISISYFAEDEFHNTDHCNGVWKKSQ